MVEDFKHLVYDLWLAQILEREVYRLNIGEELLKRLAGRELRGCDLLDHAPAGPVFIYAKVATTAVAVVSWLEKLGFNLVDTNIVFAKPVSPRPDFTGQCLVRFATPDDRRQVVEVAGRSFKYSRFHLDRAIPAELANKIKAKWVGNYFAGRRGQQMVVALVEGTIVGFLQLLYGHDQTLTIDLIAVAEDQRRKGVAADMIAFAEAECGPFEQIRVGTQIANIPSMRLYEKLGFRAAEAHYVFHYHYG